MDRIPRKYIKSECSLKSTWPCFLEDSNCQKKNKNWACIHELKVLLTYKQIQSGKDIDTAVSELERDKDFYTIGQETRTGNLETAREHSIKQKLRNINFLSDQKISNLGKQEKYSRTTKTIFCHRNWTEKELKEEIQKLEKRNI